MFFQNLKDEFLDLGCEDYLHKCFFKIESIVAGDFVLKTTGDFESQSAFAGADFFFSGLQIIFNNTAKPITYNKDRVYNYYVTYKRRKLRYLMQIQLIFV